MLEPYMPLKSSFFVLNSKLQANSISILEYLMSELRAEKCELFKNIYILVIF